MSIPKKCALLFLVCLVIYLSNQVTLGASDTFPNSVLAFNLLENQTLNFDVFRESARPSDLGGFGLIESANGHLTSGYPIGSAILSFPFYFVFWLYLKGVSCTTGVCHINIATIDFQPYRLLFEKLASSLIATISVVLFYLILKIKFSDKTSLLSSLIYGFATNAWVTNSQGLWQHGSTNLALLIVLYCLFILNGIILQSSELPGNRSLFLLATVGIFCGLLICIRPTNILFSLAIIFYTLSTYKLKKSLILILFTMIFILPGLGWNLYYFGSLLGGYSAVTKLYVSSFQEFMASTLGILVSPSRGLFIYSPILLFSFFGIRNVYQLRANRDEKLILCLSVAGLFIVLNYFFYKIWWGGFSFGSRFLTDLMPLFCYYIAYPASQLIDLVASKTRLTLKYSLFVLLLSFSLCVQGVGAFGKNGVYWNSVPISVDLYNQRLWDIVDSPISRHYQALFHQIFTPFTYRPAYIDGIRGQVEAPSSAQLSLGRGIIFNVTIKNTGTSKWFGYQSALEFGEIRLVGQFLDSLGNKVQDVRLYVADNVSPGETAVASGLLVSPRSLGRYKISLDFVIVENSLKQAPVETPIRSPNGSYFIDVDVMNP